MKKKRDFKVLSDKECMAHDCEKKLKLRLVETKSPHNIIRCYEHGKTHKVAVQRINDLKRRGF